jgi:hypothetical protein
MQRSARRGAVTPWPLLRSAEAHAAVRSVEAHARRRAVVPWPLQRSAGEHAAVLSRPGWRGGALQKRTPPCCCALAGVVALCRGARRRAVALSGWRGGALQKRTPPCHCALAGVVALCRSARRRAVALWLAWWRSAEAHAAVLLCHGHCSALQKHTPLCCCALAGGVVALCRSARRCAAVVLWLAWRSAEAHAAVLLCSGQRRGRSAEPRAAWRRRSF